MDSILRPALALMVGRGLGVTATFLIPVVLVRIFTQAEFGTYKQLFLIYSTLYGIAQLGMAESLFYFIPLAPQRAGRYVLNSIVALTAGGLLCAVLLGTTGESISRWLGNSDLSRYIPIVGVYLGLMLSSAGLEIVMVSRQHYGWASLSYASSEFFRTALFLVPVLFVADLEWLLIGAVAFGGFRLGAGVWYLVREFGRELYSDTVLWKQQLAYALPFEMAVVLEIMQATLHQYAISYNFDAATFAIYSVGCFQIPLVDLMATSAANVMMVKMAGAIRDDRPSTVVAVWHDTTRKLALILFPMVGVLLVNAREIIVLLFTDSYAASVPIFMVWSSTILLAAFPVDGVMRVYAQMRFLVVLNVVRLTLIAGLIGWFLATFQLLGGVLVTVLAMGVARGLGVGRMRKLMGVGISEILPWWTLAGTGASAVAAGVLSVVLKSELEMSMLPLLVVTCVVYAIAYTAGLYVFRVLSEGERLIVRNWLGKWVGASAKTGVLRRS